MSSPKVSKPKAVTAKAPKAAAAPAKKAAGAKKRVAAPAEGEFSGEDKVHFVKAMWEGVKAKDETPAAEAPKVEVLRRIPAQVTPPARQTAESAQAVAFAQALEQKLAAGELDVLTPEAMQTLMASLVKLYSASVEAGDRYPILQGRMAVTGTDAMIVCGALLKAVDLQVFELGMWQSWSGM